MRKTQEKSTLERPDVIGEVEVVSDSDVPTRASDNDLPATAAVYSEPNHAEIKGYGTRERQRALRLYIFLPLLFLSVALIGGLRLAAADNAFVFLAPALVCLLFAAVMLVLFARGRLIEFEGWFSDDFSTTHNVANGAMLISVFAATAQIFNSVLPESGLPFWVVSFCFAWSLWNNLFAELDNKRLLRSLIALFAFAFVAKYVVLAGLTAPAGDGGWLRSLIENPAKETVTWLLELPRYSSGTGYIQFFCLIFYFLGLYLLPRSTAINE